jgi:hypothetical protein
LNRGRLKTPPAGFGRECEEFRLIELKGEYASFILDLEAEATLLRHILRCVRCHEDARRFIEEGYGRGDWWGTLFSRELPDLLGDDIVPGRIGEYPKLADLYQRRRFHRRPDQVESKQTSGDKVRRRSGVKRPSVSYKRERN